MVNSQQPSPATIDIAPDAPSESPSAPWVLLPANEVFDEVTWLTHLDFYTVRDGVVAAFDEDELDGTPRANGGRGGRKKDVDLGTVLSQIADLVEAYLLLHARFDLTFRTTTMFVQEAERPGVARLAGVGEETWKYVHDIVPIIRGGSRVGLRIAHEVVDSLLSNFKVQVEIHLGGTQLEDPLEWKLRLLHFVYALALMSSMNSHVNDFNWQIWDDPVECFKISDSLTFRKYDIGSMGQFLGPVWILAGEVAFSVSKHEPTSDVRPRRLDSVTEEKFAEKDLDRPLNTTTEAEMSTIEESRDALDEAEIPSSKFQISASITQLKSLWNANVNFAVEEEPIDREKSDAETLQKTSASAIKSLEFGSGIVLPIGMPTLMDLDVEVVCGWYSLDPEGNGNTIAMADIEGDGEIELCDSDFLLVI